MPTPGTLMTPRQTPLTIDTATADGHATLRAWLAAHPWLTSPELVGLTGTSARTIRHQLACLGARGQVTSRLVGVAPWPRAPLHALAGRTASPPAPLRLARPEHLRALHALLVSLVTPGASPRLVARLRGEAGGPPDHGAAHPLAGLADGWLVDPADGAGLLLRWDDGDRHEWAERAWLAALADLATVAPLTAIVCATPAALRRWRDRLDGADGLPPLRLTTALELADVGHGNRWPTWLDEHGVPAPPPAPEPLPPALLIAPVPPPPRRLMTLVTHRLALGGTDLLVLRAIARQPLLPIPDLARRLACSERLAYRAVAHLVQRRLARRLAAGHGTPSGRPARDDRQACSLWATRAGLRLLAAAAGETPARFRRTTRLAGGAVARPGQPRGNRALGRLARHPRHTRDLIRLHGHVTVAVATAAGASQAVELIDWQGPVTAPVRFSTDDPTLARPRPGWARRPGQNGMGSVASASGPGQVEPDAIVRLRLDGRRLTLLIEWDRGTEGRTRLARKLRHYVGWGAAPATTDALALVITTSERREALVHALVAALAERQGSPRPPLATATIDALARQGLLGPIWWVPDAGRQTLADAVCH